jgi:hypothetical protein
MNDNLPADPVAAGSGPEATAASSPEAPIAGTTPILALIQRLPLDLGD